MKQQYWSDNGAPCWACSGTIVEYTTDDAVSLIDTLCIGCLRRDVFRPKSTARLDRAVDLSAAHREAVS